MASEIKRFIYDLLKLGKRGGSMSMLTYFFGVIVPYAAIAIFIAGFFHRVLTWASRPAPYKIPVTCGQQKSLPWIKPNYFENPYTNFGVIGRMFGEVCLFRSLFRNLKLELVGDRPIYRGTKFLWLGALAFHWSLFFVLFRHLRFFTEPTPSIVLLVERVDGIIQVMVPTLYLSGIVIIIALSYLFIRRLIFPNMRYISLLSDYFVLILLLGITSAGVLMRYFYKTDVVKVKELMGSLISFHPVVPEGLSLLFYIHFFLVCVLVAYFPFSKLVHMAGIFLSPTRNLKSNSRARRWVNPWNYPVKLHTYEEWYEENKERLKRAGLP